MGRFIDCQIAIVPWGAKAKFRRAKIGLIRKSTTIYIAIFFNSIKNEKFPIDHNSVELLPAAIRFKNIQKDLFIRDPSDEHRHSTIMREIKVLLNKDKLRQNGKTDALEKLIASIPPLTAFNPKDLIPARLSACLIAESPARGEDRLISDSRQARGLNHLVDNDLKQQLTSRSLHGDPAYRKVLENRCLKSIRISGLDSLPKQIWLRTSLHELTLTNCNLKTFPKQLELFSNSLLYLDLSNNKIETVPRSFCCKMNNLRFLDLKDNLIETLPIEIKFFRRLVKLNVSHNRLRMLPSTFSDLKSLRNLEVANNQLSQLPAFRKEDIRLEELDVSYNPLDGASDESNTFEVYPSYDAVLGYHENPLNPFMNQIPKNSRSPTLFGLTLLKIVRCDKLLRLASEESLPETIISIMQKEVFKCFNCNQLDMLPAYNSTDVLDYLEQVEKLTTTGNFRRGMTFMKLLCRDCFDKMSF